MEPTDDPNIDLNQIDSIQNLDTARMALRWALEKLRSTERSNQELTRKADWEVRMRQRAEEELKAQLELERENLRSAQQGKQTELERIYAEKLAEWERSYQDLSRRSSREAAERARADGEDLERKLRQEHGQRLTSLRKMEEELAAREREFELFCTLQKKHAEDEKLRLRAEARAEAERDLNQERDRVLSEARKEQQQSRAERDGLAADLAKAGEELETLRARLDAAQGEARQAETLREEGERRGEQLADWRHKAAEAQTRAAELEAELARARATAQTDRSTERETELAAREREVVQAVQSLWVEFERRRSEIEALKAQALAKVARAGRAEPPAEEG